MKTRAIITVLCVISFVLSACASTAPQATFTPTPMLTSTATAMPTVTPTPTATPDPFAGLNECFTWRDAKENCVVSFEDLISGRLVDYARKVTKPFPADAYYLRVGIFPTPWGDSVVFGGGSDNPDDEALVNGSIENKYKKPFTSPRSPIGEKLIFWVKGDGTSNLNFDVIAVVTKVRNQDGTDGFYTVIFFPYIDQNGVASFHDADTIKNFDDYFDNQIYQPAFRSTTFDMEGQWMEKFEKYGNFMLNIANDETSQKLLDKWVADNTIPPELEKRPLVANFFAKSGSGALWVK